MHGYMERLARTFAVLGGTVLTLLIVQTCLSVLGRSLNTILHGDLAQSVIPKLSDAVLATGIGPINGDFELIEVGMAFVVFAFLPLCQLRGAHASVDIFTEQLPGRLRDMLRAVIEIVFAAVLVLLAWQLFQGMLSKQGSGQTTLLLQFPVWWAYALSLSGAAAAAIVGIYVAAMRVVEAVSGHPVLPDSPEAEH